MNEELRETAARQRAAHRSSAQSRTGNRCSKKSGYAAGHSPRGSGSVVRAGCMHENSDARYRGEGRRARHSIIRVLRFTDRRSARASFLLPVAAVQGMCLGRWFLRSGIRFWPVFMKSGFRIVRRRRFTPRCSTKGIITARSEPCTGFWKAREKYVSGGTAFRSSRLLKARAAGYRTESALELGHHEASRPGKVYILLPFT